MSISVHGKNRTYNNIPIEMMVRYGLFRILNNIDEYIEPMDICPGTILKSDENIRPKSEQSMTIDPKTAIIQWLQNNVVHVDNMYVPKSYDVPTAYYDTVPGFRVSDFQSNTNDRDRYTKFVAMSNQMYGTSTYDVAVWVVCAAKHFSSVRTYLDMAYQWFEYLAIGPTTTDAKLIHPRDMELPGNGKWKYLDSDQYWTEGKIGTLGYTFRNLPLYGWQHPVDNRAGTILNQSVGGAGHGNVRTTDTNWKVNDINIPAVDELYIIWSDYRPVSGESAWTLLSAVTLLQNVIIPIEDQRAITLNGLCNRIVTTMLALEADKEGTGGVLAYSPHRVDVNGTVVDVDWNPFQFSIENMASATAALMAFSTCTYITNTVLKNSAAQFAERIVQRVLDKHIHAPNTIRYNSNIKDKSPILMTGWSIDQGGSFETTSPWKPNEINDPQFAVDCYTWGISIWGERIDKTYGTGCCYELWSTLIKYGGYMNIEKVVCGLGYSFNDIDNVFSAEWTVGGLFAIKTMLVMYANDIIKTGILKQYLADFEKELKTGITKSTTIDGSGLLYCNKKAYQIPFGWIGCAQPALASTGWWLYWLSGQSPWRLDSTFKSVM